MAPKVEAWTSGSGESEKTEWEITNVTKVSLETLNDLLITAVEGGTGYWASVSSYEFEKPVASVTFHYEDPDSGKVRARRVVATELASILPRLVEESGQAKHNGWNLAATLDNMDADIADIAVQLLILGEVTYG